MSSLSCVSRAPSYLSTQFWAVQCCSGSLNVFRWNQPWNSGITSCHQIHQHLERLEKEHGEKIYGTNGWKGLVGPTELSQYLASSWDLDRIYYYLIQENLGEASESRLDETTRAVTMEMETLRSRTENASMMPVHYALVALRSSIPDEPIAKGRSEHGVEGVAERVEEALRDVEIYIRDTEPTPDGSGHIKRTIAEIRNRMKDGGYINHSI